MCVFVFVCGTVRMCFCESKRVIVYVCVCAFALMSELVSKWICECLSLGVCVCVCVFLCVCLIVCLFEYACLSVCVYVYVYVCVCACVRTGGSRVG